MRLDPLDIYAHTMASTPLRILLALFVGALGAVTPLVIQSGFDAFGYLQWQFAILPIYLFLAALLAGWWSWVAIPLVPAFAWRFIVFIRGEGQALELVWIYLIAFLITIRASGRAWPYAAALAAGILLFLLLRVRAARRSAS